MRGIKEKISGMVRVVVTTALTGSWKLGKQLEEQRRSLIKQSAWLGERRRRDEGE